MVEIRSLQSVSTAEHITLEMKLSGMCSRLIAFIIDFFIMALLMIAIVGLETFIFQAGSEASKTIIPLSLFVIFFGYHLIQEWLLNGQSIGKRVFNIRVVREDGQPLGFWESLGRNLLRIVDVYFFALGILVMVVSSREKRLGDYLVGTVVIQDQFNDYQFIETRTPTPEDIDAKIAMNDLTDDEKQWITVALDHINDEEKALLNGLATRVPSLSKEALSQWENWISFYLNEKYALPTSTKLLERQSILFQGLLLQA